jgi:hypothetical protein
MNKDVVERIKDIAIYIDRFRELEPDEQSWLKELLKNGRLVLSLLEILENIETKGMTYYEIADQVGNSFHSIKQKLQALEEGGLDIRTGRDGRFISPKVGGRPRNLKRK